MKIKSRIKSIFFCAAAGILAAVLLCSCTARSINGGDDTDSDMTVGEINPDYGKVSAEYRDDGVLRVLIDPGHGFGDVGCQSPYGFDEKDLTIVYANILREKLEDAGAEVYMTHDGESFPSASEIARRADSLGIVYDSEKLVDNNVFSAYERSVWENVTDAEKHIDLFISLHINSIENAPECSGFSIDWYEANPQAASLEKFAADLGKRLEDGYSKEVRLFSDSLKDAYIVNKYTNTPSVLVELGYATNSEDVADMQNPAWQKNVCGTIADAIVDCFG